MKTTFIFFIFLAVSGAALAATAEPTSYVVTIKRIELSRNGGSAFLAAASGNRSSTIRASDPRGAIVDGYATGLQVEEGEYNAVRVTLSNSIGLLGRVVQDAGLNTGTTFCTGGTTGAGCTPTLVSVTLTNVLVALYGLTLPSGTTISDAAGEIIIVNTFFRYDTSAGGQAGYKLTFDTSSALVIESDNTIHPAVPIVSTVKNA